MYGYFALNFKDTIHWKMYNSFGFENPQGLRMKSLWEFFIVSLYSRAQIRLRTRKKISYMSSSWVHFGCLSWVFWRDWPCYNMTKVSQWPPPFLLPYVVSWLPCWTDLSPVLWRPSCCACPALPYLCPHSSPQQQLTTSTLVLSLWEDEPANNIETDRLLTSQPITFPTAWKR